VQMGRIDLEHLGWVLDNLANGEVVNPVRVDRRTRREARVALQRMIDIKAVRGLTPTEPKT
jgi:quinolinate synthase